MYEHVNRLLEIARRLLELTQKLELGDQTPERVVSFCLHGRIVDLSSAALALLKSHDVAGIPHLVRGQLEAYVDLRNLAVHPNYIATMEAVHCADVSRVLRAVTREGFATDLSNVSGSLKIAEDRLAELRRQGVAALSVSDRFRSAGLISEYYSVYPYLCSHSHNNVRALEERHIDKTKHPHQLLVLFDKIDRELAILIELSVKLPLLSLGALIKSDTDPLANDHSVLSSEFEGLRKAWAHLIVDPSSTAA